MQPLCMSTAMSHFDLIYSPISHFSGANNSSLTGRRVNWQKTKRIKSRVAKKRVGTKEKHVATAVKGVSGARTKKHQRKVERRQRLAASEAAAREGEMEVDIAPLIKKKDRKTQNANKTASDAAPMQQ